jgi:hypothetical protein
MASLLTGPRKSGRACSAGSSCAKTGGRLFDDAEDHDEEAIFHAWNEAQETRRPLLIIADAPPPAWTVSCPTSAPASPPRRASRSARPTTG